MTALGVVSTFAHDDSGRRLMSPAGATFLAGAGVLYGVGGVYLWNRPTYTDRMLDMMRADPDLKLRFGIAPVGTAGLSLGISGSF